MSRANVSTAVLTLLMSFTGVLAQAPAPPATTERERAFNDCIFSREPVVGAPFSAEAITTWQPPAGTSQQPLRTTVRYYRDRAGRVRVDQMTPGDAAVPRLIFVQREPQARPVWLDPQRRTASEVGDSLTAMIVGGGCFDAFRLTLSSTRFVSFHRLPRAVDRWNSPVTEEALGEREVGGVDAVGTRFTAWVPAGAFGIRRAFEMTDERWVSPELDVVVYNRGEDPGIGIVEYRLATLDRAEPPADLFQVHEDYRVAPPQFPLLWENPYMRNGRLRSR